MNERSFDDLARRLADPVPRRSALRLAGAALVGAAGVSGLRPRSARAADIPCKGLTPQKCFATTADSHGNRAQVCVGADWECCGNEFCASACQPWETCTAGSGCDDTRELCTNPKAAGIRGGGDRTRPTFCSVRLKAQPSTCYPSGRTQTWGWCCREGETCGDNILDCSCDGEECGDRCCEQSKVCVDPDRGVCCPKKWQQCTAGLAGVVKCCPPRDTCCFNHKHKTAVCCDSDHPCVNGKCTCRKHEERCGAICCRKNQTCVRGVCLREEPPKAKHK